MGQPLPRLIRQSAVYKLIVPEKVEEKIRYLMRKFPSTEWSGILFYTHKGNFESNDLVITCEDIFPMDLGDATFTNFKMTPDVSGYIAQNIDLFDCEMGLVHSHHTMATFFSSIDQSTLQSEGNDTNCFVSLIVNTEGTYSAAITRKLKAKKEINIKNLGTSYEFFGEGTKHVPAIKNDHKETIEEEVIEYYMLDVERHEVHNPLAFLDERFDEIEALKQEGKPKALQMRRYPFSNIGKSKNDLYALSHPWTSRKEKVGNPFLLDDDAIDSADGFNTTAGLWTPDKDLIHQAVCKMVSCSMILNTGKFDLRQWITRHMNNVYDKIFTGADEADFNEWLEFAVTFFVYHLEDPSVPKQISDEWYFSQIAQAMIGELEPFNRKEYPYIMDYVNELSTIII